MLKPTDFLLTCPVFVGPLSEGLGDCDRRATAQSAAVVLLSLLAVVGVTLLAWQLSIALVVLWGAVIGVAGWCWLRTRPAALNVAAVVEAYRAWCAARGCFAPTVASSALPDSLVRRLHVFAALPCLPVLGYVRARRLLDQHTELVCVNSMWTREVLDSRCDEALYLYLCYPDREFPAASGHGGVWFPDDSVESRRWHVVELLVPLYVSGTLGLVCGILLALVSLALPWGGCVLSLFFIAGGATCGATLALSTRLLRAALMEPIVWLAGEQRTLLPPPANEWEDCVQRIANSTYECDGVRLSEHLFLGWLLPTHTEAWHPFRLSLAGDMPSPMPMLVHKSVYGANFHITGATQSGKSLIAVLGVVVQVVRGHQTPQFDLHGNPRRGLDGQQVWDRSNPVPVLIIDLKGDLSLFNSIKEECGRLGRRFHAFTLEHGCDTSYFNPIHDLSVAGRPVIEFAELVMEMLSLFHGMSYGRSYYSKQSRDLLLRTVQNARVKPTSWSELYQLLHDELDHSQHKDVFELLSSIFALAQYPVLGPAPAGVATIHMPAVIEHCEVVYCCLPARASAMSIRDVAKMALYCFMTAAAEWNAKRGERKSLCVIDELQIVTSRNLGTVFQQCSGANMAMILSNQAPIDLNTEDAPHLADTVRTNTRLKQAFTILDPMEAKFWIEMSGEDLSLLRSFSSSETVSDGPQGSTSYTTGVVEHQTVHKRLNQNVINQVNNTQGESLVHVATSGGFTQLGGIPRRIWTPWLMSEKEYRRRRSTPWPTAPQRSAASPTAPVTVVNAQSPEEVQAEATEKYSKLETLFKKVSGRSGPRRKSSTEEVS